MSESSSYESSYTSSTESSSGEDASVENFKSYKPGGYAPLSIGEVLNERYRIIQKLGFGQFSVVYLIYDYTSKQFYAMKVNKSCHWCTESAEDEIEIMKKINHKYCSKLITRFKHVSMFGEHIVLIFNLYGETLYRVLRSNNYVGLPSNIVRAISKELLQALQHLEEQGVINTDLKPENILIRTPNKKIQKIINNYKPPPITEKIKLLDRHPMTMSHSQKIRYQKLKRKRDNESKRYNDEESEEDEEDYLKRIQHIVLSDFGNACTTDQHHSSHICTRQYKPVENILTDDYNTTADIWSFGCIVYELLTGNVLFQPELFEDGSKKELDDSHLASMLEITGGDVLDYKNDSYFKDYARSDGSLRFIKHLRKTNLSEKIKLNSNLSTQESKEWSDFILYILNFNFRARPSASNILKKYGNWLDSN